jgi:hypothetical protein
MVHWNGGEGFDSPYVLRSYYPKDLTFEDTEIEKGTQYRYKVQAITDIGLGEFSDYIEVVTLSQPFRPSKP